MNDLLQMARVDKALQDEDTAHLAINLNEVASKRLVPGLQVETEELDDGVAVDIVVEEDVQIDRRVHLCFGVTREQAVQHIDMDVRLEPNASISVLSHCIFPRAVDVEHRMDARISVGENASYHYDEKHIHSEEGGIAVYPSAEVELAPHARFATVFELIQGRVGVLDIDYG
ncbi:MAG: SufBD protein, partial [Candidatus Thermoplasmatota archaeon]|nr:SufBD protein [Candidatus Thermoplasmatota archaeon]